MKTRHSLLTEIKEYGTRWIRTGALAIIDQGIYSCANFFLNIWLARLLAASDYGTFALSYSILLSLSGFHNAFILAPMSVFGASRYKSKQEDYLALLITINLIVAICILLAFVFAATPILLLFEQQHNIGIFYGIISLPSLLTFWMMRRVCYLKGSISTALLGNIVYTTLLFLFIFIAKKLNSYSTLSVFISIAISSGIGVFLIKIVDGLPFSTKLKRGDLRAAELAKDHWKYGKWLGLTNIVYLVSSNGNYVLTAGLLGLSETGALRAIQNLISPIQQTFSALSLVLIPKVSARRARDGLQGCRNAARKIGFLFTFLAVLYFLVILAIQDSLFSILYGGKYGEYASLTIFFLAAAIISSVASGWHIGLQVMEDTRALFIANCIPSISILSVGYFLVKSYGLTGAGMLTVLTSLTLTILVGVLFRRIRI